MEFVFDIRQMSSGDDVFILEPDTPKRPKSMAVPDRGPGWDTQLSRALYAYLSSGDNQLSFLEGDIIALMGQLICSFRQKSRVHCQATPHEVLIFNLFQFTRKIVLEFSRFSMIKLIACFLPTWIIVSAKDTHILKQLLTSFYSTHFYIIRNTF